MMSTLRIQLNSWTVFLLLFALSQQAAGIQGDCDGDLDVDIGDMLSVVTYITGGAPPPNYAGCDCDGFPGVNFGDLRQLYEGIFRVQLHIIHRWVPILSLLPRRIL
jgi:hypothetical protein